MRYRGAALLAVCFTAAVSTQPVGLEVHHHAGAALPHVHPELAEATPFHHHDHDHPDRWSEPDGDGGCALRAARGPWTWHAHATSPFHRTAPARRARLPRPEPVALLAGADRGRQLVAAPVGCRSRAPPDPLVS